MQESLELFLSAFMRPKQREHIEIECEIFNFAVVHLLR